MLQPKYNRPSKLLLLLETRALVELGASFPARQLLKDLPRGDGHPVLVFPGFLANDLSTRVLRRFLRDLGYVPERWTLGANRGYSEELDHRMQQRLRDVYEKHGRKVSIIGWSLGGVYAREVARALPEYVRQVITMGSPFGGAATSTNVTWIYDLVCDEKTADIDPRLLERLGEAPPVPSTAIFTRSDGVVAWQACREPHPGAFNESVEVKGTHCGLGFNPLVFHVIADRLVQPQEAWRPFLATGWRAALFPEADNVQKGSETPWTKATATLDDAISRLDLLLANKVPEGS